MICDIEFCHVMTALVCWSNIPGMLYLPDLVVNFFVPALRLVSMLFARFAQAVKMIPIHELCQERSLTPRPFLLPVFDRLQYAKRSKTGGGNGLGTKKKLTEQAEMIKAFDEALTKLDLPPGPRAVKISTTHGRFFLGRSSGMAWERG